MTGMCKTCGACYGEGWDVFGGRTKLFICLNNINLRIYYEGHLK